MENFFAEFTHPDSLFILFTSLVAFLIGILTAWIIWRGRANANRTESEKWKKNYQDLLARQAALREDIDLKEADLVKAQREAYESIELTRSLEVEKDKREHALSAALESVSRAQTSIQSYKALIEDLNTQIVGLKAMQGEGSPVEGTELPMVRLRELEEKVSKLESGHGPAETIPGEAGHQKNLERSYQESVKRIESLEAQLQALSRENQSLRTKKPAQNGESGQQNGEEPFFAPVSETTTLDKGEKISLSAVAAREEILEARGKTWPAASATHKDDLTRIKGIGTFLEKKLNTLGFFTYEQLSLLDHDWIEKLTTAIEFFPGRIERDDWVGQAHRLQAIKAEAPESLPTAAIPPKNLQDLTVVEGIGPKIDQLLKDHDIPDLQTLSVTPVDRLREILTEAGSYYRLHDPSTWPQQAEKARKNGECPEAD